VLQIHIFVLSLSEEYTMSDISLSVFPQESHPSGVLAFCRAYISDMSLSLTSLRLCRGVDGMYVSFPFDPSIPQSVSFELRGRVESAIIDEYLSLVSG
jgi:hypothetical protein